MHHTEKEIVDIVSKQKSDLDRMFSKLTLKAFGKFTTIMCQKLAFKNL